MPMFRDTSSGTVTIIVFFFLELDLVSVRCLSLSSLLSAKPPVPLVDASWKSEAGEAGDGGHVAVNEEDDEGVGGGDLDVKSMDTGTDPRSFLPFLWCLAA